MNCYIQSSNIQLNLNISVNIGPTTVETHSSHFRTSYLSATVTDFLMYFMGDFAICVREYVLYPSFQSLLFVLYQSLLFSLRMKRTRQPNIIYGVDNRYVLVR